MSPINPHDPFGRLTKPGAADDGKTPEQAPAAGAEPKPTEEQKPKRKYTRRAQPKPGPSLPVEKPEEQEPELVAALFTTGELTIYVGDEVMHLTSKQREKLEQFLGLMTPKADSGRPRRKCQVCHQRRDVDKFDGDSKVCKECNE
jgi:hypothetical protein